MNNNKNAYEIRLEVLKMAHDDLFSKYHEKVSNLRYNADRDQLKLDLEPYDKLYPSTSDIINRAKDLYIFIEGK
jgi:hypothetical protein